MDICGQRFTCPVSVRGLQDNKGNNVSMTMMHDDGGGDGCTVNGHG